MISARRKGEVFGDVGRGIWSAGRLERRPENERSRPESMRYIGSRCMDLGETGSRRHDAPRRSTALPTLPGRERPSFLDNMQSGGLATARAR